MPKTPPLPRAYWFAGKNMPCAVQTTKRPSTRITVFGQLLGHLDLDDMRRSTEHRLIFEPIASPTVKAAATAAAATPSNGPNRVSSRSSAGSSAGHASGNSRAGSASKISVARKASGAPKGGIAVEQPGAGIRRPSGVGEQQQKQQQNTRQQQQHATRKESEYQGDTENASDATPSTKGSAVAAPKAAVASMPLPLVLKAVPEEGGVRDDSPSPGGGARSGWRSNRSGSSR